MANALTIAVVGMLAVFAFLLTLVLSMVALRVVADRIGPPGNRGRSAGESIDSRTLAAIVGVLYESNARRSRRSAAQTQNGANS